MQNKQCGSAGCDPPDFQKSLGRGILFVAVLLGLAFGPTDFASAQSEEQIFTAGIQAKDAGDWNRAIQQFEGLLRQYPNTSRRAEAELNLGYAYLNRSAYANPADGVMGREHLQYVIAQGSSSPNYESALLQYGFSFFALKMYDQAKPPLDRFVAEFPNSANLQYALYYLGMTETNLGNFIRGEEILNSCINRFPNGARLNECKLGLPLAMGLGGKYSQADSALNSLAMDNSFPYAKQAVLQRARLKIAQQDYNGAILVLDRFIQQMATDPNARAIYIEGAEYQSFCYLQLRQFDQALAVVNQIEQQTGSLTNDAAFLKIRILTQMGRFSEAQTLLEQVKNSQFGLLGSDQVAASQGLIWLEEGKWYDSAKLLIDTLKITPNPSNTSDFVFDNYFSDTNQNTGIKKLASREYIEACGTIVLDLASRYASAPNQYPGDNAMQAALFNAMLKFAQSRPGEPYLMTIVSQVNDRRNAALSNPIGINVAGSGTLVPQNPATPGGGVGGGAGYPIQPDGPGGSSQGDIPKPMTEDEVMLVYKNALKLQQASLLKEADAKLLELFTSSETLWKDCPHTAPMAALLRVKILYDLMEVSQAQIMCEQLVKEAPNSAEAVDANYYLGWLADFYGKTDDAIMYLTRSANAPQESPYKVSAYYFLGWNEWDRKNAREAEKWFMKIYRDYRSNEYWSHAGWAAARIEYDANEYVAAEEIVNNVLGSRPDRGIVDRLLFLKGELAMKNKDYPKARIAFNMLTTRYPDSPLANASQTRLDLLPKPENSAPAKF